MMRFALVIFDCDGVLVDSEALSRRVLRAEAEAYGRRMTEAEAEAFTGLRWSDVAPRFAAHIGQRLPSGWPLVMQDRLIAAMADGIAPVPGACAAVLAVRDLGLPYRVASNSSHEEMAEKFARTGLWPLVAGRLHSARDVGVGKPAPDVFLAAAAAEGVAPASCLVIEDSAPGMAAAAAAGMVCLAYDPEGRARAPCLRSLAALGPWLAAAVRCDAA